MSAAKGNGLTAGNSQPAKAQNINAATVPPAEKIGNLHAKRLSNLRALFALKGHAVHDGGNNDYIVVKSDWCMSRHCQDFSALVAFGRMLGVLS